MKLLVDNQLPEALAAFLRGRGHECQHVIDMALDEVDDATLWSWCARGGWTLISKDEDFIFQANRPGDNGQLIWVRLGNCRNAALLKAFDVAHDSMISALEAGQRIVEIR